MSNPKIRVAVLYGGRSQEHEISLQSADNVIRFLDKERFAVIPIGIDQKGHWRLGNDVFLKSIEQKKVNHIDNKAEIWFTPEWLGKSAQKQIATRIENNEHLFDVVFPALHGPLCEDGTLQGLLELANIPYVGSGVLSSAIGMDKDISKRLAKLAGIKVAPYLSFNIDEFEQNANKIINAITINLGLPVFVKPANTGSSIGITKVNHSEDLTKAIITASQYDRKILIEKALVIQELEIGVLESLEDNEPIVSVVGEIKTNHEFYSYDAKYTDMHGANLLIPAQLSNEVMINARLLAKEIFLLLSCEGMARVDLFYTQDTKEIYFNEINTLPGFTPISMYPKLMEASGIKYSALLSHLIDLAIKRHHKKSKLKRTLIA